MNGKRKGLKDNKPIGVTKSMLAVRQELQNYGVKDKFSNILAKDNRRYGNQREMQQSQANAEQEFEENPEALYPPMQVPNRPRGELPDFNALQRLNYTDPKKKEELLKIVDCERDLIQRMQSSSTFLLFNENKDMTGKDQLRKQLASQYIETLFETQGQLFPPQIVSIKPQNLNRQIHQQSSKQEELKRKQNQLKAKLSLREHQKQILMKRLLQQTKVTLNDDNNKFQIHERGAVDDDENQYMKGEKPIKRLKTESPKKQQNGGNMSASDVEDSKASIKKNELPSEKDEEEEDEDENLLKKKIKNENEEDDDEENNDQPEFEQDEYYGEDLNEYDGGDDDDDAGYGSD
ncbi:UNKNOWN [Stylonychia lemnae]|uniref:Uncharacterized protein n=1 Tax=Stylonychia lemnae TaxID=5949 RepID=A0A077ZQH9_STYLE|nr:UNKNOWN [Stylonychia lemnae]|eukprot:CDW72168.1 UNKNOWN [Stylonychia lemnae]